MRVDDPLGSTRERYAEPLPQPYYDAFEATAGDPNNRHLIAEVEGKIVGTLHLVFIRGIARMGATRAQIEAVRVAAGQRGEGIGRKMIEAAIEMAREHGCTLVQLTTDKTRKDAHRFYENLGFVA